MRVAKQLDTGLLATAPPPRQELDKMPMRPHPSVYHDILSRDGRAGKIPVCKVHERMISWFNNVRDKRQMPWRRRHDPHLISNEQKHQHAYYIWISEVMLQQTQVATVIDYWTRWVNAFPSVEALAHAEDEDVLRVWSGLGYYRRARNLLKGARFVMDNFDGKLPSIYDDLLKVPGIGPYTAGAISSIVFGQASPLLDGNVVRVLSRFFALYQTPSTKTTKHLWKITEDLVPESSEGLPSLNAPGDWNEALMELGATVCMPKVAKCGECPMSDICLARKEEKSLPSSAENSCELCDPVESRDEWSVLSFPKAKEKKAVPQYDTVVCYVHDQEGRVLISKRGDDGILAGLDELPSVDIEKEYAGDDDVDLRDVATAKMSLLGGNEAHYIGSATQVYSHQKREYHVYSMGKHVDSVKLSEGMRWVDTVEEANFGGAMKKVWALIESDQRQVGKTAKRQQSLLDMFQEKRVKA